MMWGWGAGGWIAGLWMILFPLAAALLIAWIRRTGTPSQPPQEPRPTAMEILDQSPIEPRVTSTITGR